MKSSRIEQTPSIENMIKVIIATIIADPSKLGDSSVEHDMLGNSVTEIDFEDSVRIIFIRTDKTQMIALKVGDVTISDIDSNGRNLGVKNIVDKEISLNNLAWSQYYVDKIHVIYKRCLYH